MISLNNTKHLTTILSVLRSLIFLNPDDINHLKLTILKLPLKYPIKESHGIYRLL
jgi:hypothetical protein